jgi:uncharacterized protein YggE
MMSEDSITTVSCVGEVQVDYDKCIISLDVYSIEETKEKAVDSLKNRVDFLQEELKQCEKEFLFKTIKDSLSKSFSIKEEKAFIDQKITSLGYKAIYNLVFQIRELDNIDKFYEKLISLKDVKVHPFSFTISNIENANLKALKKANEKCIRRFKNDCKIIGLNCEDYAIKSYDVVYSNEMKRIKNNLVYCYDVNNKLKFATITANLRITFKLKK